VPADMVRLWDLAWPWRWNAELQHM
jgi:hypothetical protein